MAGKCLNPLSAKFIKWSNTLKQFVGKLPTNCLSVFGHFSGLALKGLSASAFFSNVEVLNSNIFDPSVPTIGGGASCGTKTSDFRYKKSLDTSPTVSLLKKIIQNRCFPVNFANMLKTPF